MTGKHVKGLYICRLCGDVVREPDFLRHLASRHKEKLMKELKPTSTFCEKCGKIFTAVPEPIVTVNGEVKFFIPAWCRECAGAAFRFLVVEAKDCQVRFRKRRKSVQRRN